MMLAQGSGTDDVLFQVMPFTHLNDSLIQRLTAAVGPFAICQVAREMSTPSLRSAAGQGRLHLLFPQDLNAAAAHPGA